MDFLRYLMLIAICAVGWYALITFGPVTYDLANRFFDTYFVEQET